MTISERSLRARPLDTEPGPPVAATPARSHRARRLAAEHGPIGLLLVLTAVLYLTDITRNAMGNNFYAASAWAGSHNWEALLFGSLDPGNSITVDKPPVSQWVMGLSGRIFGFSSASMLIPQALMGVLSVGLMYGAVRRIAGRNAGLIAGLALALTPVAALMFRFNNPDAAMVTLMTLGAYCTVRALNGRGGRWMALAGVALGFAFLAKMLEGLMVMPALGLVYLIAAPVTVRQRILHLLGAAAALVVSAGWYVALTILWPSGSRPYLAGSTDNSFMNLVLGYNGFGRVLGTNHHGGGQQASLPQECLAVVRQGFSGHGGWGGGRGGHGGGHGGWGGGQSGIARLFTGEFGLEVSFLLPAAMVGLIAVLVLRGRAPRTDLMRAGAILFGAWTIVDGVLLAEMKQQAHAYYSLSMVPGIVGLVALGLAEAWRHRAGWAGRIALAAQVAAAGGWGFALLSTNTHYVPPLRWIVLGATIVVVALALVPQARLPRGVTVAGLVLAAVAIFGGSAAYVASAVGHDQRGGSPTVTVDEGGSGQGGFGGWGNSQPNNDLDSLLANTNSKWAAAINGSSQAAGLELNTGKSVIAVGGFTGQDPSPTLAQFQNDVRNHQIGYYVVSSGGPGGWGGHTGNGGSTAAQPTVAEQQCQMLSRGNSTTNQVVEWVQKYFTPTTVGGQTVYNLTNPPAAAFTGQ